MNGPVGNSAQSRLEAALWLLAVISCVLGMSIAAAHAQVVAPAGGAGAPPQAAAESQPRGRPGGPAPGAPPGAQPGAQPTPPDAKPDDKEKKPEGEGEKKDESTTIKAPDKPPRVPDPREFDVALDEHGRVPPFNFIGQPWPDVMLWLAKLSKSSLDWQELPTGYLNLTTQRSYSLDEVRDLINRHLHARGFTSIQAGEVLSVFKIEKLDPALVRRVQEDELYDLRSYDFVKVSFQLPGEMEIDKVKEDVKQVLSPSAKVFPLVTTKQLLVMDTVANLRTMSELLNQERMVQDGRIIPRNFPLQYARPQQVIETLYVILGADPKGKPAQTDPQAQQQQMQMIQQMQQQGKDVSKLLNKSDAPKVYLAFNRQLNSVMANAPPEQMKIIEQTIALLDVPFGGSALGDAEAEAADNQRIMKKYPLTTLEPENFMQTLTEIGGLSPYAEFKIDSKSKTLFALATESDHAKINSLVDQFDGTGRQFEVIWLRRLPADAVAATINKLMAGQTEEEEESRPRYYWDYYDRDRNKKDKPIKGFGVDADVENNRLLLWANDAEMERVRELLVKLGEIPGQRDQRQVRLIQPPGGQSTEALLEQLGKAWSAAGAGELIINAPARESQPSAGKSQPDAEEQEKKDSTGAAAEEEQDRSAGTQSSPRIAAQFVQLRASDEDAGSESGAAAAESSGAAVDKKDVAAAPGEGIAAEAPVTITVTEDGRLMLSSPDPQALDRLQELIEQLSPPERRFKIYRLNHIPASHMYWDLKDYFAEDLESDKDGYIRDWWGNRVPTGSQDKRTGLAQRRKLMITYDVPNNSILVANASPSQLAEIEQLIAELDRPAPSDSVEVRQTAAIKIHFSKPTVIAAAVKEVYRDLLSSRDKEFDRGDQRGEQRGSTERVTVINYGGSTSGDSSDRPSPLKVRFDGALSLGADDVSGILIVSAQKALFGDVVRMVRELDMEAAPKTTVQVHRLNGNVTAAALQKALNEAVGKAWLGSRPEQTAQPQPNGEQQNRDRGRDRDRGRRDGDNGGQD